MQTILISYHLLSEKYEVAQDISSQIASLTDHVALCKCDELQ